LNRQACWKHASYRSSAEHRGLEGACNSFIR